MYFALIAVSNIFMAHGSFQLNLFSQYVTINRLTHVRILSQSLNAGNLFHHLNLQIFQQEKKEFS